MLLASALGCASTSPLHVSARCPTAKRSAAASTAGPSGDTSSEADPRATECIADPALEPEDGDPDLRVVGPGRVRAVFASLPDAFGGDEAQGGETWIVDLTTDGEQLVAHGGCRHPRAFAYDRDGTAHELCVDVTEGDETRVVARHAFARSAKGARFAFDAETEIYRGATHDVSLAEPFLTGFDGGGPYAYLGVTGPSESGAPGGRRVLADGLFHFGHDDVTRLELPGRILADVTSGLVVAYAERGDTLLRFVDPATDGSLLYSTVARGVVAQDARRTTGLVVAADEAGFVLHEHGVAARRSWSRSAAGAPGAVETLGAGDGAHPFTPIVTWPEDVALASSADTLVLERAGASRPLWSVHFSDVDHIASARASCDATRCVVVAAVLARDVGRTSSALHVFRIPRP